MKKNIIWILLIFVIPITAYYWLSNDPISTLQAIAAGDEMIKFASPMCLECQELEKVFNEVMPKYSDKVSLKKIDITKRDKYCKESIKEYNVQLVPTTIFKNQDGRIIRRIEGMIQPDELENYLIELINE